MPAAARAHPRSRRRAGQEVHLLGDAALADKFEGKVLDKVVQGNREKLLVSWFSAEMR